MNNNSKFTNVHIPTDEKVVHNKEFCDNNFLSSSVFSKMDVFSKNITELRKGEPDKVTTKR